MIVLKFIEFLSLVLCYENSRALVCLKKIKL